MLQSLGYQFKLLQELPASLQLREWMLAYRTQNHGSSLRTLYRNTNQLDTCMIVLVKDTYGQVFGAVCSAPLRVGPAYYGTGQTFLFSFSPHLQRISSTSAPARARARDRPEPGSDFTRMEFDVSDDELSRMLTRIRNHHHVVKI
ncbi:TLD domain-containing protein 2-like isoform X2 [Clarias magur]|uniref:Oxidation resistance protein 1 n=1 Tax=Clarias magur TaxID=1594786 RepID=A0A8J4U366_CLAMG|nr:TLD domain-containing protein 2-like isoform X2 [Clarias magur]